MTTPMYTIQDLCDQTGLPRRTIHFYSQQGIISPPVGAGLAASYDNDHLLRLQLVPFLRRQGLRLDEIRIRFNQLPYSELVTLLEHFKAQPPVHRKSLPAAQSHLHYALPAGLMLVAPANLSPSNRDRLDQLLQAAQDIFSQA